MSKFQNECPSCGGEMLDKSYLGGFDGVGLVEQGMRQGLHGSEPAIKIKLGAAPFVCKECGFIALYDKDTLRYKRQP